MSERYQNELLQVNGMLLFTSNVSGYLVSVVARLYHIYVIETQNQTTKISLQTNQKIKFQETIMWLKGDNNNIGPFDKLKQTLCHTLAIYKILKVTKSKIFYQHNYKMIWSNDT